MIRSFRHKGLAKFYKTGSIAGIQAAHSKRLRLILGRLNAATDPKDMDLPGLRLHKLSGNRDGIWSVKVSGNWRVTFLFENGDDEIVWFGVRPHALMPCLDRKEDRLHSQREKGRL